MRPIIVPAAIAVLFGVLPLTLLALMLPQSALDLALEPQ